MASIIKADNGVSSGVTGIVQTADSSGQLALQTTNSSGTATTAMTINNSQQVGVGTTSPAYTLDVQTSGSGGVARVKNTLSTGYSTYAAFNDLGANMSVGMGGSASSLFSGSAFIDTGGSIPLIFATNDTSRMTLGTTGNLTFNTSNAGIVFNNSSALTNSTLNDYETGTWTPTVAGSGTAGTYTLSSVNAYYTKIGKQVTVWASFGFSAASGGSGYITINSFPFNYGSGSAISGAVYYSNINFGATPTSTVIANTSGSANNQFYIAYMVNNGAGSTTPISGISTSTYISFTVTYTAVF
jgi:hypothetical protein